LNPASAARTARSRVRAGPSYAEQVTVIVEVGPAFGREKFDTDLAVNAAAATFRSKGFAGSSIREHLWAVGS
jgi:hypothetical protein